jgi:hypothetical protein
MGEDAYSDTIAKLNEFLDETKCRGKATSLLAMLYRTHYKDIMMYRYLAQLRDDVPITYVYKGDVQVQESKVQVQGEAYTGEAYTGEGEAAAIDTRLDITLDYSVDITSYSDSRDSRVHSDTIGGIGHSDRQSSDSYHAHGEIRIDGAAVTTEFFRYRGETRMERDEVEVRAMIQR